MSADPNPYGIAAAHYSDGRFSEALAVLTVQIENPDIEALNLAAVCCYRLDRLDEAEAYWRRSLEVDPQYAAGYANLGNLLQARQRFAAAEGIYRRAIAFRPDFAEAHYNLGNLLVKLQRHAEAEAAYRQALIARPDIAEASFNLANLFQDQKRLAEAEQAFRDAIAARNDYADAYHNLGNLLRDSGRLAEARDLLIEAVASCPDRADAHCDLAHVLRDMQAFAGAQACYRRAIGLRPELIEAHIGLAKALLAQNHMQEASAACHAALAVCPQDAAALSELAHLFDTLGLRADAEQVYRRCIAFAPDHAGLRSAFGHALQKAGRLGDAEEQYRRALALTPDAADVHYNLGILFGDQDRWPEAEEAYRRAIALRADHVDAHNNLGRALHRLGRLKDAQTVLRRSIDLRADVSEAHNNLAAVLKDMGRMDEAIQSLRRAVACQPDNECAHRNLNYALTYHAETPREILDECLRFAARHEEPLLREAADFSNDRTPGRRLRIGYVAPDFDTHCQSLFTAPILARHDHASYEIVCYSSVKRPDGITAMIRPLADLWRDVHALDDAQLARLVREDQIDVLVDLTMHMSRGRPLLFARRPAPVQVQWLAYPGTTGSRAIRYRLTDPWIDPRETPDLNERYSEQSVWLPETFWCFDPRMVAPDAPVVSALPARHNGHITFGCLNNPCKASERTLRMWAAVLATVPDARFVLLAGEGARERFAGRLGALGVDPARVRFVDYQPRVDYLRTYGSIDIGLDTFPYNGHTTTLDALWMGVPVPSRAGETSVSRAGLSLLMNLGLGDLVAHDDDAYIDIVTRLASDLPRLETLRTLLRPTLEHSPMMDAARFTRNLEAAYRRIWHDWCHPSNV